MDKKITNKCAEGIINRKGDGKVISIIIEYLYICTWEYVADICLCTHFRQEIEIYHNFRPSRGNRNL